MRHFLSFLPLALLATDAALAGENIAIPSESPLPASEEPELLPEAKASVNKFNAALQTFSRSTKSSMNAAKVCAETALQHFHDHGDTVLCQRFVEAMPKNYGRKTAFLLWAKDHSPILQITETVEDKKVQKLVKDRTEAAIDWNLEAALEKPFWEYAPEKAQVAWGFDDVVKSITSALSKFEKSPKYKKGATEETTRRLSVLKEGMSELVEKAKGRAA